MANKTHPRVLFQALLIMAVLAPILLAGLAAQPALCGAGDAPGESGSLACFFCIWADMPVWAKALLLIALVGLAVVGGWYAGAIFAAGAGWTTLGVSLAAGASAAYAGAETMDKFFDVDRLIWDLSYGEGVDIVEDLINVISPVPSVVEDLTGAQMPGSDANDGLLDQAIEAAGDREDRMNRLMDELEEGS